MERPAEDPLALKREEKRALSHLSFILTHGGLPTTEVLF